MEEKKAKFVLRFLHAPAYACIFVLICCTIFSVLFSCTYFTFIYFSHHSCLIKTAYSYPPIYPDCIGHWFIAMFDSALIHSSIHHTRSFSSYQHVVYVLVGKYSGQGAGEGNTIDAWFTFNLMK
jgi:hypothetical protein